MRIESQKEEKVRTELRKDSNKRIKIQNDERERTNWQNIIEDDTEWQYDELTEEERKEQERQEAERRRRRQQRIAEMKREKHRREMLFRYVVPSAAVFCLLLLIFGIGMAVRSGKDRTNGDQSFPSSAGDPAEASRQPDTPGTFMEASQPQDIFKEHTDDLRQAGRKDAVAVLPQEGSVFPVGSMLSETVFTAHSTEDTNGFSDSIDSSYGIIIDVESGVVLAEKGEWTRVNPASMTKILTLLVAAEHIADFDDTFTMTIDITDYCFLNDCSNVGFLVGEEIPVRDLFYGTALKSGGDAAVGLAVYVAGSQEVFVDMMNAKLEELGLSETTHFTNCVGLYDENHYTTPYDMAVILKEAADNEFCRQVLSEHHYITTPTAEHPEGIDISNWFLRRIEDRDTHGEVLCAKTGYVKEAKSCAASLAADHSGREYICVTAGSYNSWSCIRDHTTLYQQYLPE